MRIEHKRIVLREWTLADLEAYRTVYGDAEVTKYLGGGPADNSIEATRERIERIGARSMTEPHFAYLAVLAPGIADPIGTGLCLRTKHSAGHEALPEEYEIGWHLGRAHWGQGYGTEVGEAMLRLGLEWHERVVAVAFPQNEASIRIMGKIGMRHEGVTDRFFDIPGLVCYSASR
ncbi:MAG: GNAT family N-acetyltransferase [Fimbriimonadaceae bacterium]|nr:GNAT family N-acetyltransferase [Fimbriimonadaceae bacterium]